VVLDLLDRQVLLVHKVFKVRPDPVVLQALKVLQGLQVLQDLQVLLALKVYKVQLDQLDLQDLLVLKVFKVPQARLVLKDLQATHSLAVNLLA
jgi:hypothetical protein